MHVFHRLTMDSARIRGLNLGTCRSRLKCCTFLFSCDIWAKLIGTKNPKRNRRAIGYLWPSSSAFDVSIGRFGYNSIFISYSCISHDIELIHVCEKQLLSRIPNIFQYVPSRSSSNSQSVRRNITTTFAGAKVAAA